MLIMHGLYDQVTADGVIHGSETGALTTGVQFKMTSPGDVQPSVRGSPLAFFRLALSYMCSLHRTNARAAILRTQYWQPGLANLGWAVCLQL